MNTQEMCLARKISPVLCYVTIKHIGGQTLVCSASRKVDRALRRAMVQIVPDAFGAIF